jgi:signal transduction histidine kinase
MNKPDKILIVDDEAANVRLLERILELSGYNQFVSTSDARQVVDLFRVFQPDLILTDLHMPHLDGFGVMEKIRALTGPQTYLPIVVLTADITPETRRRALEAGATDFLLKPFDHMEVVLRIKNLLETRFLQKQLQQQNATLEEHVRDRTSQLEEALSALKATQQQVIQQERFRALGTMAGGIAHDFNNALASILGYSELLLHTAEKSPEKTAAYAKTIMTAASDAARMVARLREFSRPATTSAFVETLNLNELVEEAIALTLPKWKTGPLAHGLTIEVRTELGNIPPVQGDPAELREALFNLIFNAVDAMPCGGVILIRTLAQGDGVRLEVSDNGTGMTEDVRQRCLEPYFTTKGSGGTGLGLAMVYGIIHRHAGKLEIESQPGQGSTFIIELAAGKKVSEASVASPRKLERPLHILVVDDQPLLCQLLTECLAKDQHTVETAANGREGLEKYRTGRYDLVLTDKAMPEMDGDQMAIAIRKIKPTQPIILLTGYGEGAQDAPGGRSAIDMVLGKPLSIVTLRKAMVDVVTGGMRNATSSRPDFENIVV